MVHLRVVAPPALAEQAYRVLLDHPSALNVVRFAGEAEKPDGDVLLCDVAREDASVVVAQLRELGLEREASPSESLPPSRSRWAGVPPHGALVGVLISVTTIPAAANVGVATAYGDWTELAGASAQLAVNLLCIVAAVVSTLGIQRWFYRRRRLNAGSR